MSEPVKDERPFQELTRDEQIEYMAKRVEQAKKQFPDQEWKFDTQWWVPVVDYGRDIKTLDEETQQKLNVCTSMIFKTQFSPNAFAEVQKEVAVILADHPKLLEQTNNLLLKTQAWDKMREYAQEQAAKGTPLNWEQWKKGDDPLYPK